MDGLLVGGDLRTALVLLERGDLKRLPVALPQLTELLVDEDYPEERDQRPKWFGDQERA